MNLSIEEIKEKFDRAVKIGWVESLTENGDIILNASYSTTAKNGKFIGKTDMERVFKEAFVFIGDYMLKKYRESFYFIGGC